MPYIDIDPADGNRLAYRMLYYFFFVASLYLSLPFSLTITSVPSVVCILSIGI